MYQPQTFRGYRKQYYINTFYGILARHFWSNSRDTLRELMVLQVMWVAMMLVEVLDKRCLA